MTAKIDTGVISYSVQIQSPPPKSLMDSFLEQAEKVELESKQNYDQNNMQGLCKTSWPVNETAEYSGGHDNIRETVKRKSAHNDGIIRADLSQPSTSSHNGSVVEQVPQKLSKTGRLAVTKNDRERLQRISRDAFRRKVLTLANSWIWCCENSNSLRQNIVVNEDSCKPKSKKENPSKSQRKKSLSENNPNDSNASGESAFDTLISKQNGFYYYHILCTKEVEALVARMRPSEPGEAEMNVLVDRLAMIADIYLRVMFNNDIKSAVFIKFDDANNPALFARQTKPSIDTCITGPPGRYWTKILHFDSLAKTSQHITLQRVRSGRLMQDSTFIVVGEGGMLEQMYSITPERIVSPLRHRRCFKEMYNYVVSIPENDLFYMGWEMINEANVLDPIKTFLPKVIGPNERTADDMAFINYMDMFITMMVHRHKMETMPQDSYQRSFQLKVHRTDYMYELAGRIDHPGVYYYRNHKDYITELCMVNMVDSLFDGENMSERMLSDDGIYFYDIQPVTDVLIKLKQQNIVNVSPAHENFYKYILSECDDVKEMIAYSKHTIDYRLEDVLKDDQYVRLHNTDPARSDPNRCLDHMHNITVKCNLSEYRSTYYIEKSYKLTRVFAETPTNLHNTDCVLRSYRLKWKEDVKNEFVMYPIFTVVFRNLSAFQEIIPENVNAFPDEDFSFPNEETRILSYDTSAEAALPERQDLGYSTDPNVDSSPFQDFGVETRPTCLSFNTCVETAPNETMTVQTDTYLSFNTCVETGPNETIPVQTDTPSILAVGFSLPEFEYDREAEFYQGSLLQGESSSIMLSEFFQRRNKLTASTAADENVNDPMDGQSLKTNEEIQSDRNSSYTPPISHPRNFILPVPNNTE